MEQTRALNALEPFLALSKSANSPRAAVDLVTQATSAPNTYVFAELLQAPTIQALRDSPEHQSYLRLLELFAWGTWQDYVAAKATLPALSDAQTTKLKLLSLLPLSATPTTHLTYAHLRQTLDIPTTRALEDLLITAIYSHLIAGSLDPAAARVTVTAVAPLRDLAPGSVPALNAELGAWAARCDDTLQYLDAEIAGVRKRAAEREAKRRREEALLERVEAAVEEKAAGANAKRSHTAAAAGGNTGGQPVGGAGGGDGDVMELDEGIDEGEESGAGGGKATRGAKRAFSGIAGRGR